MHKNALFLLKNRPALKAPPQIPANLPTEKSWLSIVM